MEKIGKIIPQSKTAKNLKKEISAALVCAVANRVFKKEKIKCTALSFKNKRLILGVKSSPLASTLRLNQKKLLDEINCSLGAEAIKAIAFRL